MSLGENGRDSGRRTRKGGCEIRDQYLFAAGYRVARFQATRALVCIKYGIKNIAERASAISLTP
jgi:hypothetical protein